MQRATCLQISIAFWICLSVISNLCSLHAQQVLLHESFENGDSVPDNWYKGAAIPSVEYIYDKSGGTNGTRSLGFKKTDRDFSAVAQWAHMFDYDAGERNAKIACMIKARGATKATVELQFYNLAREVIGSQSVIYIGPKDPSDRALTHHWKRYSGQTTIPEEATQIAILLRLHGPGSLWFDDINLSIAGDPSATSNRAQEVAAKQSPKVAPKPTLIQTSSGAFARYILLPPTAPARRTPDGQPLILVLAGGDGSETAFPFVQSIHNQVLKGRYAVAQIIAPPRDVWPTRKTQTQFATTEVAIEAVVDAISDELSIDRFKVIAIAWSSSGPATYASMLSETTPLHGALIAMSYFRAEDYPLLPTIHGRRFYLLHSPEDELDSYSLAQDARDALQKAGNIVEFKDYKGGHGWHGKSVEMIPDAINWLLKDN